MIARLAGTLAELTADGAVIDVAGVGYQLLCSARTLEAIGLLQRTHAPSMSEVLDFVEKEKLYGLGCGLIDVTLLMSTLITPGATLMTADRRLSALAERFKVLHRTALH